MNCSVISIIVVLLVGVRGDGHSAYEEAPSVKVGGKLEKDSFTFESYSEQSFPYDGKPSDPIHKLTFTSKAYGKGMVKGYLVWSLKEFGLNCTTFSVNEALTSEDYEVYEFTSYINIDMMGENGTQLMSRKKRDAHEEGESDDEILSVFEVMLATSVLIVNGTQYCQRAEKIMTDKPEMNMLRITFPQCLEFDFDGLKETIHDTLDIDTDRLFMGNLGADGSCHYIDVYFQYAFADVAKVQKAMDALTSKSGFGRFSPSGVCITDVSDSFLTRSALKMCFAKTMEEKYEDEKDYGSNKPTCAGVSTELAEQYKARIKKYDCMLAEYSKKYGIKAEGCEYRQQTTQTTQCRCNTTQSSEEQAVKTLLTAANAPLYAEGFQETLEKARVSLATGQLNEKLAGEVSEAWAAQWQYMFKATLAFCMVEGYGEYAMDKFEEIRQQVRDNVHGDEIVNGLMKTTIEYYLNLRADGMVPEQDFESTMKSMVQRIRYLLVVSKTCSNADERKRVWETLMNMNQTFEESVSGFNDVIGVDAVSNATRAMVAAVKANPKGIAKSIFMAIYSPIDLMELDGVDKFKPFLDAMEENKEKVIMNVRNWLKSDQTDFYSLFFAQLLFMSPAGLDKDCNLMRLVDMVMPQEQPEESDDYMEEPNGDMDRGYSRGGDYMRRGYYEEDGYRRYDGRDGRRYYQGDMRRPYAKRSRQGYNY